MLAKLNFNNTIIDVKLFSYDDLMKMALAKISARVTQHEKDSYINCFFEQYEILMYDNQEFFYSKEELPLQLKNNQNEKIPKLFSSFNFNDEAIALQTSFTLLNLILPFSFLKLSRLNYQHNEQLNNTKTKDKLQDKKLFKGMVKIMGGSSLLLLALIYLFPPAFNYLEYLNIGTIIYALAKYKGILFSDIYSLSRFETQPFTIHEIDVLSSKNNIGIKTTTVNTTSQINKTIEPQKITNTKETLEKLM